MAHDQIRKPKNYSCGGIFYENSVSETILNSIRYETQFYIARKLLRLCQTSHIHRTDHHTCYFQALFLI